MNHAGSDEFGLVISYPDHCFQIGKYLQMQMTFQFLLEDWAHWFVNRIAHVGRRDRGNTYQFRILQ
ncbi:MAG: hypothetical protein CBE00_09720 [Planctomycetaceae bacterium TMED240]|nr:MAG: hypothetical protein CBE00_09720 [Planctomycetaceae bacterium TMED240]